MMNKTMAIWLKTTTALTSILVVSMSINPAHANPKGGKVVEGDVKISQPNSSTVQVNQNSQKAIVDWRSFDIAPNETTRFVQPNSRAWILNRVNGSQNPTTIQGRLEANGNVAIVNPDGILFSQGASVDVNSLIATTHNISNDDFMAGRMNFHQPGNLAASVINEGTISIGDHGLGAFVAPGVRNSGVITARFGSVSLAAGNSFTLDLYGDGLVNLAIGDEITKEVIDIGTGKPMSDLVKNSGTIKADGGRVALKAATARRAVNAVINNTGIIEANTIGMEKGMIVLGAQTAASKSNNAPRQKVKVSGRLQTAALPTRITVPTPRPRSGGEIEITAEDIELSLATIDASGVNGGGTILIGGDYLGGNGDSAIIDNYNVPLADHDVPTATYLTVDAGSIISADATDNGDGGKIILWSDDTTSTAADITARGGNLGGDGGFIETSGKQLLDVKKAADASAVDGAAGTWLLDPDNLTVTDDVSGSSDVTFGERANPSSPHYMTANGNNSTIESSVIETGLNNGTDVFLVADGHIGIEADIEKSSGDNATLTVNAGDGLYIFGTDIVSASNQLNVKLIANNLGIFNYTNSDYLTTPIFQTNGGYFDIEAKGSDSGIDIRRAKINTMGGNVILELIAGNSATGNGNDIYLTHTMLETQGGNIKIHAVDGRISSAVGNLFDTSGGDFSMITEADKYPNNLSINTGASIRTNGGDVRYLAGGQISFAYADIKTEGGDFKAANNMLPFLFSASRIDTSGGNAELFSADYLTFPAVGSGDGYQPSRLDSGSGVTTLRADDYIWLGYGTLLKANQINATAEQISYQSTPLEGQPEIPSADYPLVSKSGITLTGSEFDIPLLGDETAKLELNFEGDGSGNERYSLTPIKGFSTIGLNRSDIDSGSYWFWIYGSGGDNIRGTFEPDGAHFTQGLSIKTSRSIQIDVGDQADTQSGLYFPSSENSEIFTTLDSTDGKIEFFGVNNVNGEAPLASSLSVGGTKNVWLNSVKYSAALVPDPTPTTYTPKPVSGASLPTGDYVIGERIDIPLPILFSVDGGTIVSQTVFRPTDGNFQIITVNGQKRLVGTYNGNPGTINLTFEAISDTQKSAQLSLPITFTSANVVTPTPVVTPEPTPTVITSQKEEVQEEVTLVENPENRVKIPVRPIGKPVTTFPIEYLPYAGKLSDIKSEAESDALHKNKSWQDLMDGDTQIASGIEFKIVGSELGQEKSINFNQVILALRSMSAAKSVNDVMFEAYSARFRTLMNDPNIQPWQKDNIRIIHRQMVADYIATASEVQDDQKSITLARRFAINFGNWNEFLTKPQTLGAVGGIISGAWNQARAQTQAFNKAENLFDLPNVDQAAAARQRIGKIFKGAQSLSTTVSAVDNLSSEEGLNEFGKDPIENSAKFLTDTLSGNVSLLISSVPDTADDSKYIDAMSKIANGGGKIMEGSVDIYNTFRSSPNKIAFMENPATLESVEKIFSGVLKTYQGITKFRELGGNKNLASTQKFNALDQAIVDFESSLRDLAEYKIIARKKLEDANRVNRSLDELDFGELGQTIVASTKSNTDIELYQKYAKSMRAVSTAVGEIFANDTQGIGKTVTGFVSLLESGGQSVGNTIIDVNSAEIRENLTEINSRTSVLKKQQYHMVSSMEKIDNVLGLQRSARTR